MELLEYAILQRFPKLTVKEVQTMLQLTPLEKTVAGQELIEIGIKRGIHKGELIGKIQLAQRMLNHPISSQKELAQKSMKALKAILHQLDVELQQMFLTRK